MKFFSREWRRRHRFVTTLFACIAVVIVLTALIFRNFLAFALHPFRLFAGEKTYLLLLQNNYELRPAGGFISAFGLLNFRDGIPTLNFEDVYGSVDDHPYVSPPAPLGDLLAHPTYRGHSFRDANTSPDFPESAAALESFLKKTRPFQKIDGVIAVDLHVLERLLDTVGGIKLDTQNYSGENVLEAVENSVANIDLHDIKSLKDRKGLLQLLVAKVGEKAAMPWRLPRILKAFTRALSEKHMLLFFKDETLQSIVEGKNWAGRLSRESEEDILAVVDANYGGGKSNRYVKRSVYYDVDLEKGQSTVTVRYDHPGEYYLPLSTDYRSFLRVFAPADHVIAGGELRATLGSLVSAGSSHEVPIRSSREKTFTMRFPPSTLDELTYRLRLWKQPGTNADYYSVTVRVPLGMSMESSTFQTSENIASWQGFLSRDVRLSFRLIPDRLPPRAIDQKITSLNEFVVTFNEPLLPGSLSKEMVRVIQSNQPLTIESVFLQSTQAIIRTNGMSRSPEERYVLSLQGASDFSGNALGARTFTFYQRL